MKTATRVLFIMLLLAATGFGIFAWRERARRIAQLAALEEKVATARSAIDRVQREREAAERELATLRRAAQDAEAAAASAPAAVPPPNSAMAVWERRVETLRSLFVRYPHWVIPELELLSADEIIFFARDAELEGEEAQRKALRDLRALAKRKVAPQIHDALHEYALAHGGRLPADLRELASQLKPPLPDAVLKRYALAGVATVSDDRRESLLYERAPVDELYDTRHVLGTRMSVQFETNPAIYLLTRAVVAYAEANGGRQPGQPVDLVRYLEVPIDAATLARYFQNWENDPVRLGLSRTKSVMMFRPLGVPREPVR